MLQQDLTLFRQVAAHRSHGGGVQFGLVSLPWSAGKGTSKPRWRPFQRTALSYSPNGHFRYEGMAKAVPFEGVRLSLVELEATKHDRANRGSGEDRGRDIEPGFLGSNLLETKVIDLGQVKVTPGGAASLGPARARLQ
jgi:hypothetical protein